MIRRHFLAALGALGLSHRITTEETRPDAVRKWNRVKIESTPGSSPGSRRWCSECNVPICPICKSHQVETSGFCRYHDKVLFHGLRYGTPYKAHLVK